MGAVSPADEVGAGHRDPEHLAGLNTPYVDEEVDEDDDEDEDYGDADYETDED
jgi:hypothetical protein